MDGLLRIIISKPSRNSKTFGEGDKLGNDNAFLEVRGMTTVTSCRHIRPASVVLEFVSVVRI